MNDAVYPNLLRRFSVDSSNRVRDRRVMLVLFLWAVALYFPGIFWGLPAADGPSNVRSQAPDELAPLGPFIQLSATLRGHGLGAPQWPLAHYLVLALFYAPYLLFQLATGGWAHPSGAYPYGFQDPVAALQALTLIARGVSVLMGAGTVVATYWIGRNLWDRASGFVAAVLLLLLHPMFYYARTSNVDVPSLFWGSVILAVFARFLQDGQLTVRRATWLGLLTAAGVATKDQNFAVVLLLPLAILPLHFQAQRQQGIRELSRICKAPLVGGTVCAGAYVVLSGLALRPAVFLHHLDHILTPGRASNFYRFPPTLAGYATLAYEALSHLIYNNLDWMAFLAAIAGIVLCWRSHRRALALLLPIPGLFLFGLVPVRYVTLRYVMPWALVLVCFAGYVIVAGLRDQRAWLRLLAALMLLGSCTFSVVRGAELTYLLYRGSLYDASEWLTSHVRPSDRVEYFGWEDRVALLPRLKGRARWSLSTVGRNPGSGAVVGEFLLLMGPGDLVQHSECPAWVHQGLRDGSLGYVLVARFQTPTILPQTVVRNPEVQIFVRRDRERQLLESDSSAR